METKKITLSLSIFLALFVFKTDSSVAQTVGTDAYIKGNSVEIGLSGLGGFEGCNTAISAPPAGMHPRSATGYFGFVANPQLNSWATFDGDFFTPGSPENGWGFEFDTIRENNNCDGVQQVNGAITAWSHTGTLTSCDWEGDFTSGTDVHFKINYQLQDTALFYITTVSITNNTGTAISNLYYDRNLDPDNNEELSGDFTTQNTILSQIDSGGATTSVTATQTTPWNSSFTFVAVDSGWVAGYGGFSNRDPSDMYNGIGFTQTVGASNFGDEAIYLAHKIPTLAPGITHTFRFVSVFDPTAVASAITALNNSTVSTNDIARLQNNVAVYPNPFIDNTTISIGQSVQLKNTEMRVYDILGKEVITVSNIQTHEFKLEKNNLRSGVYVYKIINNGAEIGLGKLIIKGSVVE